MNNEDISTTLLEKVKALFERGTKDNAIIKKVYETIENERPLTYDEANAFAQEVGTELAGAFKSVCTPDLFENGMLYYGTASKFIMPMLESDYEMVADVAQKAQESLNKSANIGLKAQKPEMNKSRAEGIVRKVSSDRLDKTAWILDEGVVNFSQSIVDDAIQVNAKFQYDAGLNPTLTRKMAGNCCDWCANLAGTYKYGEHPADIFRRHRYCRCTVVFNTGKGIYQSVHNRKYYATEHAAEIAERKVKLNADAKAIAKEKAAKELKRRANLPENKNAEWAKEIRRKQHIEDWYKSKNRKK